MVLQKKLLLFIPLIVSAIISTGCGQNYSFKQTSNDANQITKTPNEPIPGALSGTDTFLLQPAQTTIVQDTFAKNTVSTTFQVIDPIGFTINDLKKNQFVIQENGQTIPNFDLSTQNNGTQSVADIVIVLDVTTSMDSSIDQVKTKISSFVDALSKSNIKANLCLVTFGEQAEDVCDKFVVDDPATPQNENLQDIIKRVNAITTHGGGTEPDENQLVAMEAAAKRTPWHTGAQRVAILITDASFHYSPDNIGEGVNVPRYEDTLGIIKQTQMQTFIIGYGTGGYDRPLKGFDSMTHATGGQFYNLGGVLTGSVDMNDIFKNIASRISGSYVIQYVVDDNPNLDPTLTQSTRVVTITITDPSVKGTVKLTAIVTTQPSGHAKYKKRFTIANKDIDPSSVKVKVNGNSSSINVLDKDVELPDAPPAGSQIQVSYLYKDMRENLTLHPILLIPNRVVTTAAVKINGIKLNSTQFTLNKVSSTTYSIELAPALFDSATDPVLIKKLGLAFVEYSVQ